MANKKKKKKKLKIKNIAKLITIILILILSLICFEYIKDLDILPNKYLYLFLGILLFLNLIGSVLLMIKGKITKIFSVILYLLLAIISIIGIKYAGNTINFLQKGFNNNIEYTVYNVIVPINSSYNNINDLNNSKMGYLFIDTENTEYLDKIESKIDVELNQLGLEELYDGLLNNKIDAIIINEGYVNLLENEYEDFSVKTKTLDTIKIEKETKTNTETIKTLKPINIYLSGSDSRSGVISTQTLSDVNMILTINPNTHTVLLTNIPRDYYVQLHGTTGYRDKLTHAGLYGIDMSMKTIGDFMDTEIDYYVKVGFQSVIKLVDLIGGVDIYSDTTFKSHCKDGGAESVYVKKGMNHFTGAQALSYARERYAYKTGDIHRGQNQQQVIEAVLNKIMNDKSILLKYDSLLNSFSELYKTNLPKEIITLLIKQQLEDMPSWSIEKQTLLGYDGSNFTYSWPNQYLYVMIPDDKSVQDAITKIDEVLNSENKKENNQEESIK